MYCDATLGLTLGWSLQALDMLAGLEAAPAAGGGFTFRHDATGLAFAICPAPRGALDDDSDAEGSMAEPELAFQPISLGTAVEVRQAQTRWRFKCISLYVYVYRRANTSHPTADDIRRQTRLF